MSPGRFWTMVFFALACACSGPEDDNSGSNDGTRSADPATLIDGVSAAQCRTLFQCCADRELDDVFDGVDISDEESCAEAIRVQSEAFLRPALQRAIDAGTIVLRETEVEACLDSLDERACEEFEPIASADVLQLDGCRDVVEPQLTLSAFCTEDFECETGFCSHPPSESEGACKNPPQTDDSCLNDRCDAGLYCTVDGICDEKLGDGELCSRNADCESELCAPDDDGELVCETIPELCTGS